VDLSAAYQWDENIRVNLGIRNIFDEEPNFLGDEQDQANTYPQSFDIIGPRVFLSASYIFD